MGGKVPINLASAYKSDTRTGIRTPDENLQMDLKNLSESDFQLIANVGNDATAIIKSEQVMIAGITKGRNVVFKQTHEDDLILSFCNKFDPNIACRLEKEACVKNHN